MTEKTGFVTQFDKGFGMERRAHNIQVVIKLLKEGKTDEDIINLAGVYLRDATVREYLKVAKYSLQHKLILEQQSQTDYAKESEQKEKLTKAIEAKLESNPNLSCADIVQEFSSKDVDEDLVAFCYDIALNHVRLKQSPKNEDTKT